MSALEEARAKNREYLDKKNIGGSNVKLISVCIDAGKRTLVASSA